MANNRLFHCLISKNPSHLTKFYNEFGMDFKTVSESCYLSTVAPLCIMEKYSQKKSCLIWSEEICPEFKDAFGLIQLEIIEDIGLIENKCNFNSIIRCPDIDSARQKFSKETYKWTSEKHGNGPRHYHGSIGPHHLEIYPNRKQKTSEMSLEFYFETNIFPEDLSRKSDLEILSLLDPENRRFVVGLQH